MKNTRKFMAAVMALTMVSALSPMSAFAADTEIKPGTNGTPNPSSAGFDVKYTYTIPDPTFTVTIPAGVTLSDSGSVNKSISAEDVKNMEANGKKIVVTLDSASNNATGDSTFKAKNGDSEATYTISSGETAVKVGDKVAEFTADGSSALTFSKITLPASPVAGDYTETLTFGISVENAATTRTVTFNTATDGKTINKDGVTCNNSFDNYVNIAGGVVSEFTVSSGQFTKIEVTASDTVMTGMDEFTQQPIAGWSTTGSTTATWTGKSSTVPFGTIMGNNNPVTIVFTIEE